MPTEQIPDVLRAFRLAYKRAELWPLLDQFLLKEKTEQRKHILWPQFKKEKTFSSFLVWFGSLVSGWWSGYSTKPLRVLVVGFFIAIAFAVFYLVLGTPNVYTNFKPAILESIYFSFTTFATLGYGDISYGPDHPMMRILSTVEAWGGAVVIALFVVVLARKVFR
jgi:hypothetical protein